MYPPPMLVNCSGCRTPLQLPSGARSIRCALCQAITHIADPRSAPPPPPPQSHSSAVAPPPSHVPAPLGQLPHPHGRKRAVICGISYRFSRHELKGCINDAKCMRHLLINKFKFAPDSILMLTEEETDPYRIPNKQNLRMALYWLVQGCTAGDSLVFHYSGHGSRQRNYNGDEVDGYDETLCPLDFETQGMIVDDEINATIVRPLPHGVKLHSIIDACHSGTYVWEDHRPRSGLWKGTAGGEAISISGCDDDQTSADTSALSKITSTGAMTFCFIQAIERSPQGTTYGNILNSMRTTIRNTGSGGGVSVGGGGGGVVSSVLTMLLTGGSGMGGLRQGDDRMQRNDNSPPHQACASCKHQRKKCNNECILSPYFPARKSKEFQAVHKVFGVSNVQKMVRTVREEDRTKLSESLTWEALWRQKDPVLGSYGEYRRISEELKLYKSLVHNQSLVTWNNSNNQQLVFNNSNNNKNGLAVNSSGFGGFSVVNNNGVGVNREIINGGYTSRNLQGGWGNLKQDQRQQCYAVINGV
ncbi:hypothetical protein Bca101_095698 [Brassica carinata]